VIHPRVEAVIAQVKETFGDDDVGVTPLSDGSIWLTVSGIDLGPGWSPRAPTLSVKLDPTFPDSAPYPWYLPEGAGRSDGAPVDRLSGPVDLDGSRRLQLSLNAPWSSDSSLADRILGVARWLRSAGQAISVAS
jgi:hypothetical protein